jgi:hypothetical protein
MRYHQVFGTDGFAEVRTALEQIAAESGAGAIDQSSLLHLLSDMYGALPLASETDPRRVRMELSGLLHFAIQWCHGEV